MKYIQTWQATQWVVIVLVWWGATATAEETAMATEPVSSSTAIDQVQEAPDTPDTTSAQDASTAENTTSVVAHLADSTSVAAPFMLDTDEAAGDSIWGVAMRLGFGLSIVVLLAWGAAYLLKKSSLGRQLGTDSGTIRIVERAYLGPKKAVYLVEIGGRALALGVTETNIAPLSQWEAGEIELKPRDAAPSPFAAQLKSILGQKPRGEQ